jgi:hypothetical protein
LLIVYYMRRYDDPMHVRVSRVSRHGKTYEYAQLVESFRRPDGMPAHRVIASLGDAKSLEVENLRTALAATLQHRRVAARASADKASPQPVANLRYLDVAVLLELWRRGLDELLGAVTPLNRMPASSVVAALVSSDASTLGRSCARPNGYHGRRCRSCCRSITSFNNTRIHRASTSSTTRPTIDAAPGGTAPSAGFAALRRCSSTRQIRGSWARSDAAARAKTKEGCIERKIGIVLLCNQLGYPMR